MKDASDSELSDLEDEQPAEQPAPAGDDIGEIEPSYFSNDGVPVFVPSMDQFKDFTLFVSYILHENMPPVGHCAKKNNRCTKSTNTACDPALLKSYLLPNGKRPNPASTKP
jgi:hypothetical protein